MTASLHVGFGITATIAVLATVVWGFVVVGSPDTRRLQRLDDQRLEDLQTIQGEIQLVVRDRDDASRLRQPLPATLEDAARQARGRRLRLVDPQTGEPYGYAVRNATTYELSATFALRRDADHQVFWNHPAGRYTFTIDALAPP